MDRETWNLIQTKGDRIREVTSAPRKSEGTDGDARIFQEDLYIKTKGTWLKLMSGDKIVEQKVTRNIDLIVNRKDRKHTDKSEFINELAEKHRITLGQIAYAGDDIFDIEIMKKVKWSFCQMNSPLIVHQYADLIDACEKNIDVMPGESLTEYIKRVRAAEAKEGN